MIKQLLVASAVIAVVSAAGCKKPEEAAVATETSPSVAVEPAPGPVTADTPSAPSPTTASTTSPAAVPAAAVIDDTGTISGGEAMHGPTPNASAQTGSTRK